MGRATVSSTDRGHRFLGVKVTVRLKDLPRQQDLLPEHEGLVGEITKWTPAEDPADPLDLTLFRASFDEECLCRGIDLEEDEVLSLWNDFRVSEGVTTRASARR